VDGGVSEKPIDGRTLIGEPMSSRLECPAEDLIARTG
jgi:hypothetical protein